jgi:hypothetical protein
MKRYFLGAFVALVFGGAAMFNASLNNSQNGMSVIALANIEVLAGESSASCECHPSKNSCAGFDSNNRPCCACCNGTTACGSTGCGCS